MRNQPLAVATLAATIALSAGMLNARWLRAQAPAGDPAFEAASVKQNKAGDGRITIMFQPGGRFTATGVTLRQLIATAYGTPQPRPDSQIVGGPNWIASDRFDVIAKAGGDPQANPQGPPNQTFLMIRTLLKERFKLMTHSESRDLPVYALLLARGDGKLGTQFRPSTFDCATLGRGRGAPPPPLAPGERPPCGIRMGPGNLTGGSVSLAQLTTVLSRFANRIVIDRTGLTGSYDVDLTWTPDQLPNPPPGGPPPGAPPLPPIDPNGPSLFTAIQEQLGLKLDPQRGPVDVVVIDGAEHPPED